MSVPVQDDTKWPREVAFASDSRAREWMIVLVKTSFRLSTGAPLEAPEPIRLADRLAPSGAVLFPGELSPSKAGTDIVCAGNVYAPGGKPCRSCAASLRVGTTRAAAQAFGRRRWERVRGELRASEPEPFDRVPLGFERAYGGRGYARNPLGLGFWDRSQSESAEGLELPQLERADDAPIASPDDCRLPAGFSAVPPQWEPRRSFAGTYDDCWKRRRAPLLPDDFDDRFFQVGQVASARPLLGGEPVELVNLTASGVFVGSLPRVLVRMLIDGAPATRRRQPVRPALDLVVLEPDADRVSLVVRMSLDVSGQLDRLPAVRIVEKRFLERGK